MRRNYRVSTRVLVRGEGKQVQELELELEPGRLEWLDMRNGSGEPHFHSFTQKTCCKRRTVL